MKLYGHPMSSNSRRVQMLCEELRLAYDFRLVDLAKGEQYGPDFLKLNPNGKVPVIDDEGFILWESQAIMRYLASKHGVLNWYPADLKRRAIIDQWLDWQQTRLSPDIGKLAYQMLFMGDKANKQVIEDAKQALPKILAILDAQLAKAGCVCGVDPTLADLAMLSTIAYLEMCRYDFNSYRALSSWYDKMSSRPSFTATSSR